jgi:hypothetical protein
MPLKSLTGEVAALQKTLDGLQGLSGAAFDKLWQTALDQLGFSPGQTIDLAQRQSLISSLETPLWESQYGYVSAAEQATMTWYADLSDDPKAYQPQYLPNVPGNVTEGRVKESVSWAINTATDLVTAKAQLAGSVQRMVMDGSRESVVYNADKEGVKYVRHCNYGSACNWCLTMATRGTVFKSAASATKGHDKCKCFAVPIRKGWKYDPPQIVKDAAKKYEAAKAQLQAAGEKPTLKSILKQMDAIDASKLSATEKAAAEKWLAAEKDWKHKQSKIVAQQKYVAKKKAEKQATGEWLLAEAQWKAKQAEAAVAALSPEEVKKQKKKAAQEKYLAKKKAEKAAAEAANAKQAGKLSAASAPTVVEWDPPPDGSDLTYWKSAGGSHGAQFWKDKDGNGWLIKPQSEYKSALDAETAKLQQLSGLIAPPTYTINLNGKMVSAQKMFTGGNAFPGEFITPKTLSADDLLTVQKNQVFDWLIANHDTHAQQWVRATPGGPLVGVDKGQAFKWYTRDRLGWDFHPNKQFGEHESIYNTLWKSFVAGDVEILDPSQGELANYIHGLMNLDDDMVRNLLTPYAKQAAAGGKLCSATDGYHLTKGTIPKNDVDAFLDAVIARKNSLANDFDALYAKALKEKGVSPTAKVAPPAPAVKPNVPPNLSGPAQNFVSAMGQVGFQPTTLSSLVPTAKGGTAEIDAAWAKLSDTDHKKIGKQLAAKKFAAKKKAGTDSALYQQLDAMTPAEFYAWKTGVVHQDYKAPGAAAPDFMPQSKSTTGPSTVKPEPSFEALAEAYNEQWPLAQSTAQDLQQTYGSDLDEAKKKIEQFLASPSMSAASKAKYQAAYDKVWGSPAPSTKTVTDQYKLAIAKFEAMSMDDIAAMQADMIKQIKAAANKTSAGDALNTLAGDLDFIQNVAGPTDFKNWMIGGGHSTNDDYIAKVLGLNAPTPAPAAPQVISANEAFALLPQTEKTKASKALAAAKYTAKKNDPALAALYESYTPADYWTMKQLKADKSLNPVSGMNAGVLTDMKKADGITLLNKGLTKDHPLYKLAQDSASFEYKDWLLKHGATSLSGSPANAVALQHKAAVEAAPTNPPTDPAKLKIIADLEKAYLAEKPNGTGFNPIKGYTSESLKSGIAKFDAEIGVGYLTPAQLEQVLVKLTATEQQQYLKNYALAKGQKAADDLQKIVASKTSMVSNATSAGVGYGGGGYKSNWKETVPIKPGTEYTPDRQNSPSAILAAASKDDLVDAKGNKKDWKDVKSTLIPDPTAPVGSSDNPHVFDGGDEYKILGGLLTSQNPSDYPHSHLSPIISYTGSGYGPQNGKLRQDLEDFANTGKVSQTVKNFDAAFHDPAAKVTEEWLIISRSTSRREFNMNDTHGLPEGDSKKIGPYTSGGNHGTVKELSKLVGHEYTQLAYGSTSLDIAPHGMTGKHVRVLYRVPPGTRLFYVGYDPSGKAISQCSGEREVLFPRQTTCKVLEVRASNHSAYEIDVVVEVVNQPI